MARIDPFAGVRSEPVIETKEFTDPRHTGKTLTLTLKGMESDEASVVADDTEELCARYLPPGHPDGDRLREAYGIEYVEFPYVGGRPVKASRTLLNNASTLYAMQQAQGKESPYSIEEFIALSVTWPSAWREVCSWANELNRRTREQEGNASGAVGETE